MVFHLLTCNRDVLLTIGRQRDIATLPKLKAAIDGVIGSLQQWDQETVKINSTIQARLKILSS